MSRELGTAVLQCPLKASLAVEVARQDGRPLSDRVKVRLRGPSPSEEWAGGHPARVAFWNLEPGAYSIVISTQGDDEEDYVPAGAKHEGFDLTGGQNVALLIEIDSEYDELIAGSILQDDEPALEVPPEEGSEDDDAEIEGATLLAEDEAP